jgi:hypothetical protein
MQCIQEVLLEPTNYTGSENTHAIIAQQIRERFGEEAVKEYDPLKNCRTFRSWLALGYRVKKGEKALKSVTFVEKEDEHGKIIAKYPKSVALFFFTQVEKIEDAV